MESNKLLIGLQFKDESGASTVFELIVVRDINLKQLLDGIKYGLMKRGKAEGTKSDYYKKCINIYIKCLKAIDADGTFRCLTLTSHNDALVRKNANNRVVLSYSDLGRKLEDIGFITSTQLVFDCTESFQSFEVNSGNIIPAFNPSNADKTSIVFPNYNISDRQLYKFDDTPVEIIPPSEPPKNNIQNLFTMLLPSVLMLSTTVLVRGLMSKGSGTGWAMVIISGTMGIVSMITTIMNWMKQKKDYAQSLVDWRTRYQDYIENTIDEIKKRKNNDVNKLCEIYPDVNDIIGETNSSHSVYSISPDIFSRAFADDDFLTIRLGLSNDVKTMFEIKGAARDVVFSSANFSFNNDSVKLFIPSDAEYNETNDKTHYLSNLPNFISKSYRYMNNAPLLFSMKECLSLGIVSQSENDMEMMIERLVFDLCFHHSPDDLQFVVLFKRTENLNEIEKDISLYKFLPHFRGLFSDRAQFIFNSEGANTIFSNMLNIMGERANTNNRLPHIVFLIYDEYDIKEHAFAQYLPDVQPSDKPIENKLGLTFIFPKKYKEHLPHYCNNVITINNENAVLIPHNDVNLAQRFAFSVTHEWKKHLYNSYKILSALSFAKISQNGKVPSSVSIFELFDLNKSSIDVDEFWNGKNGKRKYDIKNSIAVPIGKTDSGITYLDLHEKSDGPHMLVAGTTGSGKSETIISYLLGLCLCFRPDEVNLMLVDMKGGGFIKRIGTLPHVVGSVTDVDGDENGTGAEYMLKRFLNALTSEIRRRKILFNSMYVDSITGYIAACRDIESHIKSINNRLRGENKEELSEREMQQLRKQAQNDVLAHLILVVDEFTELKRFSTENNDIDFIGEITTIARVGRSLGFHIILISQNIEGAITDDIRVNSKSRLCLKVATRQASKEMIGNDLAASPNMPGNGRGYLLVGTGSKFEYFQSAYSGATVEDNIELPINIIEANKTGAYTEFYSSEKDNTDYINHKKELEREGKLETQLNAIVGAIKTYYDTHNNAYPSPHIVFQQPLPNQIVLKDGIIFDYKDGKYTPMREV